MYKHKPQNPLRYTDGKIGERGMKVEQEKRRDRQNIVLPKGSVELEKNIKKVERGDIKSAKSVTLLRLEHTLCGISEGSINKSFA